MLNGGLEAAVDVDDEVAAVEAATTDVMRVAMRVQIEWPILRV